MVLILSLMVDVFLALVWFYVGKISSEINHGKAIGYFVEKLDRDCKDIDPMSPTALKDFHDLEHENLMRIYEMAFDRKQIKNYAKRYKAWEKEGDYEPGTRKDFNQT